MRASGIAVLALLILAGVFWANLPRKEQKLSVLHDQVSPFESLLPHESDLLADALAESAPLCAQQVPAWEARPIPTPPSAPATTPTPIPTPTPPSAPITTPTPIPTPTPTPVPPSAPATTQVPETDVLTEQEPPSAPALQPPAPHVAPASYIYFYTGVPVRSVPVPTAVVNTGVFTPAAPALPVSAVPVSMPVVQSYGVPVFVPRVVPSRVGAPKLVYSNGVVIKPKVYFPHQPVRNSLRGVTP